MYSKARPNCMKNSPEKTRKLHRKGFVKEIDFKSGVKGLGSDRW